jgi:hypothetical protein
MQSRRGLNIGLLLILRLINSILDSFEARSQVLRLPEGSSQGEHHFCFKILYPSVILAVNAWCRGSSGDTFGSDTSVFSLLLLWLRFAVGRIFFQFSFFSCEPLLGGICLLTGKPPFLVWNQSFLSPIKSHVMHTRTTKVSYGRFKRSSFIRETRQLQRLMEQYPTKVQVTPPPHCGPPPRTDKLQDITINTTVP